MDEPLLRQVVAGVESCETLARVACTCRLLRQLVAEELQERGHCPGFRRLLGVTVAGGEAAARAVSLLSGSFRRTFLEDLAAAEAHGCCFDGRRQTWDLLTLPKGGQWLSQVHLLATDARQYVLMYGRDLRLLGALVFRDRAAGPEAAPAQPRLFFGLLSTLLLKCPLSCGLLCLEPPLLSCAADYLLHSQHQLSQREELAVAAKAAAAAAASRRQPIDDDVHLVRQCFTQLLRRGAVLAGSLGGSLEDSLVRQLGSHGPLHLRYLDISGNRALSDASIAQLLALSPQLRVLHAAGTHFGPASLAALAGRQPQADGEAAQGQDRQRQRHGRQRQQAYGADRGTAAAQALEQLRLQNDCGSQQQQPGRQPAAPAAATGAEATPPQQPLAPCERLDIAGCHVKGSALRRAVRCLPCLRDLRLSSGLAGLLEPLAGPQAAQGSRAGSAARALGQLTRLEALDGDDLAPCHVAVLLQCCTALRRLSLSGKQLAAEQLDRQYQQYNDGTTSSTSSITLPSLEHLEAGWGTGGSFLLCQLSGRLLSLTAHFGAALSDWHLRQVAAACPSLARLCLRGANVSDAGVAAVLQGCTQLTTLQLLGCTGPVTDALAAAAAAAPGGPGWRPPAFRLQELRISWGAGALSDSGLAALLDPGRAGLRVLTLKGCSSLTDEAWSVIAQHSGTLRCLSLEHCGALPRLSKAGAAQSGGSGGGSSSTSGRHAPMTAEAALSVLTSCRQLVTLMVRGCVVGSWGRDDTRLREACTALQSLSLE